MVFNLVDDEVANEDCMAASASEVLLKDRIAAASAEVLPGQGLQEAVEQLRVMIHQERTPHYSKSSFSSCSKAGNPDYLKPAELTHPTGPSVVDSRWRDKICEWVFDVVDHFDFDRDAAAIALDYLDRSVTAASSEVTTATAAAAISKRDYQLYAIACLYLATKLHAKTGECYSNGSRKVLNISAFQELSRGFFTVETIEKMESKILFLLKWRVNPPIASQFLVQLLRFLPRWTRTNDENQHSYETVVTRTFEVAKYLTELCCCEAAFACETTQSFIAYGCLLCAFDAIQETMPLPNEVIARFLCNVAVASEVLMPGLEQTMTLRRQIKDLAPTMFRLNQPTIARSVSIDEGDESSMEAKAISSSYIDAATVPPNYALSPSPTKVSSVFDENNSACGVTARKRARRE